MYCIQLYVHIYINTVHTCMDSIRNSSGNDSVLHTGDAECMLL